MSRSARAETRESTGRNKRVPLGVPRAKMTADQRKGYTRRWFNDVPGRLQSALAAGYEFVVDNTHVGEGADSNDSDLGSKVSMHAGTNDTGSAMKAYLMEIPTKYYEEDQTAKQAIVDETDDAIKHGAMGQNEGRYVPAGGIKIRN